MNYSPIRRRKNYKTMFETRLERMLFLMGTYIARLDQYRNSTPDEQLDPDNIERFYKNVAACARIRRELIFLGCFTDMKGYRLHPDLVPIQQAGVDYIKEQNEQEKNHVQLKR